MFVRRHLAVLLVVASSFLTAVASAQPPEKPWLWTTARALPKNLTNQGSGYFAIVEGKNGCLYIGTAKYGVSAYLVEYDPATQQMTTVVDCMKEIGSTATGFAAQSKIHTRNNVGPSGKIYFGTKQGYPDPKLGEKFTDYPGGYPMVYDPATRTTKVYPIPVPHHGIISITPDESRNVAYISTCADTRPESSHFLKLDLETGKYQDLGETNHVFGFIVVDKQGRAYHPQLGGDILRYDPKTDKVERLKQLIDGKPPTPESHLADENSHCINWEIDFNKRMLYAVAMSGNQLYGYDLATVKDGVIEGKSLGKLCEKAESTDCRALCVAPGGLVWAAVTARYGKTRQFAELISYKPGDPAPTCVGPIAVKNPDFTPFADKKGEPYPWHQGFRRFGDGNLIPTAVMLGVCATRDAQYVLALAPLTLLENRRQSRVPFPIPRKPIAGITTLYRTNSHGDLILSRMEQTETLDGKGRPSSLHMAAVYADQVDPKTDISRKIAADLGIHVAKTIPEALTAGTDGIAVEGAIVVAEHGEYGLTPTGAEAYPKRKFFEQIFATLDKYGRRGLPVFCDKHLSDTFADAKFIYDECKKRDMPLMAGSSLPSAWRYPPIDMPRGAKLKQIVCVSFHRIDIYGFHGLEGMQSLVERRAGGETGVVAVQTLSGDDVWKAGENGTYDRKLLDTAILRMRLRKIPEGKTLEDMAKKPLVTIVDYADGLRSCLFTVDGATEEWTVAWKDDADKVTSLAFVMQEDRPYAHFAVLHNGVEQMMHTGRPTWPAERTLLTSGIVDAALHSLQQGGTRLETPQLNVKYESDWNWRLPIDMPPERPRGMQ